MQEVTCYSNSYQNTENGRQWTQKRHISRSNSTQPGMLMNDTHSQERSVRSV